MVLHLRYLCHLIGSDVRYFSPKFTIQCAIKEALKFLDFRAVGGNSNLMADQKKLVPYSRTKVLCFYQFNGCNYQEKHKILGLGPN